MGVGQHGLVGVGQHGLVGVGHQGMLGVGWGLLVWHMVDVGVVTRVLAILREFSKLTD